MTKHVITTGASTVVELIETSQYGGVRFSTNIREAVLYDTVGDAMRAASKANNILGKAICIVVPVETETLTKINENAS